MNEEVCIRKHFIHLHSDLCIIFAFLFFFPFNETELAYKTYELAYEKVLFRDAAKKGYAFLLIGGN